MARYIRSGDAGGLTLQASLLLDEHYSCIFLGHMAPSQ